MFGYYLLLSLRSLKRHYGLSILMMIAIALGIGASTTMLTVLHDLAGNPLPHRSGVLFHPQLDPRPRNLPDADSEPPDDLTFIDAVDLYYRSNNVRRRALMSANWLPTRVQGQGSPLRMLTTRATTRDFFGMFGVSFLFGSAWSTHDDTSHARVVVLSKELNNHLFGGTNSVGRELIIATKIFRVIGVIDDWNPQPRFYDLNDGSYNHAEQMYIPFFTWLDLRQDYGYGPMRCWGKDPSAGEHDPKAAQCSWIQFWIELDIPLEFAKYRDFLNEYSAKQHALGRFERLPNIRLRGMLAWLDYKRVIPITVRMQTWAAFGVFFICIVNMLGLLAAKFLRKAGEIGLRRALGASKSQVFIQCLIESCVVGVAGGALGLPLVWFGTWLIRKQAVSFAPLVHLDVVMLSTGLLLSLLAAMLAGAWPAWRASQVTPAIQVKTL